MKCVIGRGQKWSVEAICSLTGIMYFGFLPSCLVHIISFPCRSSCCWSWHRTTISTAEMMWVSTTSISSCSKFFNKRRLNVTADRGVITEKIQRNREVCALLVQLIPVRLLVCKNWLIAVMNDLHLDWVFNYSLSINKHRKSSRNPHFSAP